MDGSSIITLISAIIIILCGFSIFLIKYRKVKKINQDLTLSIFVDQYSDKLIDLCRDTFEMIVSEEPDFENDQEKVTYLVNMVCERLEEEAEYYEIDMKYLSLLSNDAIKTLLSTLIYNAYNAIFNNDENLPAEAEEEEDLSSLEEPIEDEEEEQPKLTNIIDDIENIR